jgi:ribosomal protein S1
VIKIALAGAFVDIGLDKPGVLHISQMRKEHVKRVEEILNVGQEVDVWVRRFDKKTDRIELTMHEPLALDWRDIKSGMIVNGKVTRIEKFGVFIEIGAERPGLAHISELTHGYIRTPDEVVKVGDEVDVKVLEVNRRKKQIKLSLKELQVEPKQEEEEEQQNEPLPTAMEFALRRAMEDTGEEDESSPQSSQDKQNQEIDEIMARTLENKVRTE